MNKPFSVLFVDDDPNMCRMIELFSKDQDINIQCAGNGRYALKYLAMQKYDLIFTDLQMPEMDGLSFLRHLRQTEITIPVIIISAFGQESDTKQALNLGASDVMSKPFDRKIGRASCRERV